MKQTKKLVIIGNGMAGSRLLQELVKLDNEQLSITVIGAEPGPAYNRILLSSWLSGQVSEAEMALATRDWYQRHEIRVYDNDPVIHIDCEQKQITTYTKNVIDWDYLVLATGSRANRLNVPGREANGVMCLRSLQDARDLHKLIRPDASAVVIGGGLLGLEAACSLADQGMSVTVVHNAGWPMNRQLDEEAGNHLADSLRLRGIRFHGDANCSHFNTTDNGSQLASLELADGTVLPCSIAIMALGITPEVELAHTIELKTDRAIKVDAWLQTSKPDIFALGECCQIGEDVFGLVAPVYQQARILAMVLNTCASSYANANIRALPCYHHQPTPTRLKVSGVDVFYAGDINTSAHNKSMIWRDAQQGHYRRLWWRDNTLQAVVMFGDVSDGNRYAQLIETQRIVASRSQEMFGLGDSA
ncbi:MAG: FAD-dependent oxidoreductase [Pseudohongiella sp.]